MAKSELTPIHRAFVQAWLTNGFNGVQAYLKVKPTVSYNTAQTQAGSILGRSEVQAYIHDKQVKNESETVAERNYLILQAHKLGLKAEDHDKLDTALKAVDSKAKLAGLYTQEVDQGEGYGDLLRTLVIVNGDVNLTAQQQKGCNPVDITPNTRTESYEYSKEHEDLLG